MSIIRSGKFKEGYNEVINSKAKEQSFMLMDFGIYILHAGSSVKIFEENEECLFMLIEGRVAYNWNDNEVVSKRISCFNESPELLHVPRAVEVAVKAISSSEIIFVKTRSSRVLSQNFIRKTIAG